MKVYIDCNGKLIKDGTVLIWHIEQEVKLTMGDSERYIHTIELTAKNKGEDLVFISEEGHEWLWSDIVDRLANVNLIRVKSAENEVVWEKIEK